MSQSSESQAAPDLGLVTILDGPVGTELHRRGVPTPAPAWSAAAIEAAPEVLEAIHRDYAAAGATVHTANTFRTRLADVGPGWARLAERAVALARGAVPAGQRVAGSLAPLADCYSPWLSPPAPRAAHRELARCLAGAGCDLLLCETFPHVGEALVAVEEAVSTGLPTWVAFTAGPDGRLLSPASVRVGAAAAVARGASAVLVNCVAASETLPFVVALQGLGVPFGAYANAGAVGEGLGWGPAPGAPERYLRFAESWVDAGATLVGACCGTSPAVVAALADRFTASSLGERLAGGPRVA